MLCKVCPALDTCLQHVCGGYARIGGSTGGVGHQGIYCDDAGGLIGSKGANEGDCVGCLCVGGLLGAEVFDDDREHG